MAAARFLAPKPFATISLHPAISDNNSREEVSPATMVGVCFMELAISSANGFSAAEGCVGSLRYPGKIPFQGCDEWGEILGNDLPENVESHVVVSMDQTVS